MIETFDQDRKGQLGLREYCLCSAEAMGTHGCLVFVAYSLLHRTYVPAGPGPTWGLIHTMGDACPQQGRALLQRLLMFVHDQLAQDAPIDQVFAQIYAKQRACRYPAPTNSPMPPSGWQPTVPRRSSMQRSTNDHVLQPIDVDDVMAEQFALWRRPRRDQEHAGLMPRTFLMRAVHVAETDAIRAEAEQPLLTSRRLRVEGIARTCIGAKGTEENPTTRAINRVFQGMRTSDNFGLDNEPVPVGSPETVIRQGKQEGQRLGDDIFCAGHRMGTMPLEQSSQSLQLFGSEVIPAFP
jgi:hypothetical protein